MADKRRKSPIWRRTFLRALARTGTISVAAAEAGVEPETVHRHKRKDEAFAEQCTRALAKGKANAAKPRLRQRARGAGELVLRRTRGGGAKLVRATPGRWCAKAEALFFETLAATACVNAAARACGFSPAALYNRREAYPEFAEKWDRVLAEAKARIPDMLAAAAIASLDPEAAARAGGRRGWPKVDVDQAIRISAIEAKKAAAGAGRRGRDWAAIQRKQEQSEEELARTLTKLLEAVEKRQRKARLAEGWSDAGNGLLIPPGWVRDRGRGEEESGEGPATR